jgi:hypothetical protein
MNGRKLNVAMNFIVNVLENGIAQTTHALFVEAYYNFLIYLTLKRFDTSYIFLN